MARRLESYGAVLIDADHIAREVVEPGTPGMAAVVAEFGEQVLRPDGWLDRDRLGEIVFADSERRERLNQIVHPLVGQRSQELFEAAPADAVVVYDVPLLVENDLAGLYDVVVVVDASPDTQVERLQRARGMAEEQARQRIAAQADRARRLEVADVVIDNDGPLDMLDDEVGELWDELHAWRAD